MSQQICNEALCQALLKYCSSGYL